MFFSLFLNPAQARPCRLLHFSLVTALVAVLFCGTVQGAEVVDRIVAVVNGEMITLSELNNNLETVLQAQAINKRPDSQDADVQELRRQVLDKMIDNILLEEQAKRFEIEVSQKDVQEYIDDFMQRNKLSREHLQEYLRLQGQNMEEYKAKIQGLLLRNRLITAMVTRKAVVTDEEIEEYYRKHKNELASGSLVSSEPGGLHLRMIVFDSPQLAQEVREKIASGEFTFAQAARQYSVGPAADQGGDLGSVQIPDLVPELKAVASNLPPGQLSKPFSLSGKTALIVLQQEGEAPAPAPGSVPPLEEVREQIRAILEEPKMEKLFAEYTQRLRDQALIDIKL